MKIGIDASNLRAGGGVTHIAELLAHARPQAHGIDRVIVWGSRETLAALSVAPWLELVHVPALDRSLRHRVLWRRRQLTSLARAECDLLFVPGGGYDGSFHPHVTMCRNMLPFVWREMARYGLRYLFFRAALLRFLLPRSFRRADAVIYLNAYARERVGRIVGDRGSSTVIPHGISERFRIPPRVHEPIEHYSVERPFRVLYTSIIDVYKHQWNVAEAVIRLRRKGIPVVLDLAGPPYPPSMRKLQRVIDGAGAERDAVRYHGAIPHRELPDWYRRADCFVFASTCENMPNILLEAMAAGLPIVCSKTPPMPDILGDAGIYCDAEDPASIADALARLIADRDLRADLAQRAFERSKQFSWERCSEETFAYLASIARGGGSRTVG